MARSPASAYRNSSCNCLSRSPPLACRCPSRRAGPRKDRQILSRIEEYSNHQSPQSFCSLETQLTSSYQGSDSSGSAYSTGSYDDASSVTSTTVDLEEQHYTSPPFVATPTSSEASFGFPPQYCQPVRQQNLGPPCYPAHANTWPSDIHQGHRPYPVSPIDRPALLAGIDHIVQDEAPARFVRQNLEFVSRQGPSPTQHQQYPKRHEPWHTQSLRQDDLMEVDQQRQLSPTENVLSPTSSNERGSRRNGPLTAAARRNANLVRQLKACKRCVYMKETCDEGTPCKNCRGKKGRKWKAGCTRRTLDELRDVLFPAPISRRHNLDQVNGYIYNFGFWYLDHPAFRLKLDTGLSRPLELIVKEIEGMDAANSQLRAFQTCSTSEDGMIKTTTIWNPPIVPYMANKEYDVRQLQAQLRLWMDSIFQARHDGPGHQRWPWPCFEHVDMNWEGEVVERIQDYYRQDFASHALLQKAQCLLFFGYILDHSFVVHEESQQMLLASLSNPPQPYELQDKIMSPESITRFIKMIVYRHAHEVAKTVLSGLQEILHKMALGQETSTARSDLAFCLTFLLLVFLAQSQNRLLMLAQISESEQGINLSQAEAEAHIAEMENTLGSYMIHFHEFAVKRRKQPKEMSRLLEDEERHAQDKDLMGPTGQIRGLFSKYYEARPSSLELGTPDINVFEVRNTHRLCWKFVAALVEQ